MADFPDGNHICQISQGQEHIGQPNEDTTFFSLQRESQAQDDVIFEDMDSADRHQGVESAPGGPRTPSPSAEKEEGSEAFASSPSKPFKGPSKVSGDAGDGF